MVKALFEALLEELGKTLKISDLHPDRNNSCLISLPNKLKLQLEMDSHAQNILLGCDLGPIPPGRYRENVFKEALKSNGLSGPNHGTVAFSQKTEHIILFKYLNVKDLTGEKIADAIGPFTEKALKWKTALEHGEVPLASNLQTSSGMFGLRP